MIPRLQRGWGQEGLPQIIGKGLVLDVLSGMNQLLMLKSRDASTSAPTYMCVYVYVYMHLYLYICENIYICIYVYIHIYIYVCAHVYTILKHTCTYCIGMERGRLVTANGARSKG